MLYEVITDLLFENSRPEEAIVFYQNIVDRFGGTNESQLIQTVVRAAKIKLHRITSYNVCYTKLLRLQ